MKKIKKNRGIAELKNHYGHMFVLPWTIGIILFFAIPLIQSIWYSFAEVKIKSGGISSEFRGLANYKEILIADPSYTGWLKSSITSFLYSLPIIILLSIVLAMLLNQKFRGRLFFRALYFLPVIISTGAVIKLLFRTTDNELSNIGVSEAYSANMFSVDDITEMLGIGGSIGAYITTTINKIFDLVWSCGIQTVLFLAGLQSVPRSLYEVLRVRPSGKNFGL